MEIKRLLLSVLVAMLVLPMMADDEVPALCINQSEGENQVEISEILSIKYTDTDMIVNYKDGTRLTFALDEIVVMELGRMVTAICTLAKQSNGNGAYTITDLQGKLIAKGKAKSKRQVSLPTKQGVYLLTIDGCTSKILVK